MQTASATPLVQRIVNCIREKLDSRDVERNLSMLITRALSYCRYVTEEDCMPWQSLEWQKAKAVISEIIASCICGTAKCNVYRLEMHGGEPSNGLGDKDVDLAIDCRGPLKVDVELLEPLLEELIAEYITRLTGLNPYKRIRIPNIVEVHSTREFLVKKYVEAGPPLAIKLC